MQTFTFLQLFSQSGTIQACVRQLSSFAGMAREPPCSKSDNVGEGSKQSIEKAEKCRGFSAAVHAWAEEETQVDKQE